MTIQQFYTDHHIPTHLQRHMLRVTALGQFIARNWRDPVNEHDVVKTLLLHDTGNLLKFELEKGVEVFDEGERELEHWLAVKAEMQRRYDPPTVEGAIIGMAKEAGATERQLFLLTHMTITKLEQAGVVTDPEQAICTYCDYRVAPWGYVTLQERIDDLRARYQHREEKWADAARIAEKTQLSQELEAAIQREVGVNLQQLPEEALDEAAEVLRGFQLST